MNLFPSYVTEMHDREELEKHGMKTWGPFLESSGNFSGPKSNFQTEKQKIRARVLVNKLLHFVSLTDSFIMLDAKLLKPLSCM